MYRGKEIPNTDPGVNAESRQLLLEGDLFVDDGGVGDNVVCVHFWILDVLHEIAESL